MADSAALPRREFADIPYPLPVRQHFSAEEVAEHSNTVSFTLSRLHLTISVALRAPLSVRQFLVRIVMLGLPQGQVLLHIMDETDAAVVCDHGFDARALPSHSQQGAE